MEIIVGKMAETGSSLQRGHPHGRGSGDVPVRVLKVRSARSRRPERLVARERRGEAEEADPVRGKVLVLMVPDGTRLPQDLETGNYQIRLRIVPEKQEETPERTGEISGEGGGFRLII